jgi:hypothetical protein
VKEKQIEKNTKEHIGENQIIKWTNRKRNRMKNERELQRDQDGHPYNKEIVCVWREREIEREKERERETKIDRQTERREKER